MMNCWYVVYCKPRQEVVAEENLLRQGFRVYLPRVRSTRRRRGQWIDAVEPLFPRYIFIHIDSIRCSIRSVVAPTGNTRRTSK